jgi:creatinine amidohydrolase
MQNSRGLRIVAIRDLAESTWEEVRDLPRSRTVAVLPIGAIEAHGPHLPLGTDVIIATAMARAGAERIEAQGWHAVVLPALPYTSAPFGADFPGTLSVSSSAVTSLVLDVHREITRHGFAATAIANAHLDPANLRVLAEAASRARADGLAPLIFPDLTRKPWATRLGEEFRSGACHAGRYEGSVVLAERPDLVRETIRATLPPNPASLAHAIRSGVGTFREAGGARAYFGWPADASAGEGRETVETLGAVLAEAVRAVLAGEGAA